MTSATTEPGTPLQAPPCPKCGWRVAGLTWHGANRFNITVCSSGLYGQWTSPTQGEHMHCICARCHYDWAMEPEGE